MTISYRESMADNWRQIKYIFTKTVAGRYALVLVLATPLVAPLAFHHAAPMHHTPQSHPAASGPGLDQLLAITSLTTVITAYATIFSTALIGLCLGTLILPKTTITVEPEFLGHGTPIIAKTRWKEFSTVTEEPDHFYFAGWRRAFIVPKRAFNSSAEADAFFDLASDYWRKAKGIAPPPPNTSGVWPPAPTLE